MKNRSTILTYTCGMPTYVYDHVHLYFMWMTTSESMGIRECLDLGLFYNMEIDRRTFELL